MTKEGFAMTFCSKCGAAQQDGAKYCSECGTPITKELSPTQEIMPQTEYITQKLKKSRGKKPLYRRWWVWVVILVVIVGVIGKRGRAKPSQNVPRQTEAIATMMPATTVKPAPTALPTSQSSPTEPTSAPSAPATAEDVIRPEVKEFLDAYEVCMNEYVEFMKKYMNADPNSMASMMGDYYKILSSYTEYSEKIEALDESDLSNAELAYYLEVTNRVSQKLLTVAMD